LTFGQVCCLFASYPGAFSQRGVVICCLRAADHHTQLLSLSSVIVFSPLDIVIIVRRVVCSLLLLFIRAKPQLQLDQPDLSSAFEEVRQYLVSCEVISNRAVKYVANA
jgi:hypothetical protein